MTTNSGFGVPNTFPNTVDSDYESDPSNLLSPLDSPLSDTYLTPFSFDEYAASLGMTLDEYAQWEDQNSILLWNCDDWEDDDWIWQIKSTLWALDWAQYSRPPSPHDPYGFIVWNLDDYEDWDWEIMSNEWIDDWEQYFAPPTPTPPPRRTYADVVRYGPLR